MIKLLDCTLRDGGYINDWNFGKDVIKNVTNKLLSTGIDIFEIGFLKDEEYSSDRTVFNQVDQIKEFISPKQDDVIYSVMVEVVNPLPIEKLENFSLKRYKESCGSFVSPPPKKTCLNLFLAPKSSKVYNIKSLGKNPLNE